jgi:hypothetical protein
MAQPIDVPVFYGQQPVPGVMAQIELPADGSWGLTYHHFLYREDAISAAIRALVGPGLARSFTPYEIGPQGVRYRRAVPFPQGEMNGMMVGGPGLGGMMMGGPGAAAGAGGLPAPPVNIYAGAPHVGELNLPADANAPIGMNLPPPGTEMANFHGEFNLGRVYTKEEFRALEKKYQHGYKKENPMTRRVIQPSNVRYYKSKGGKSRRFASHSAKQNSRRRRRRRA